MRIGITGQQGFIGRHLFNNLGLYSDEFECVKFENKYFNDPVLIDSFVSKCDIIVHLAAMNRNHDEQTIYQTNLDLIDKLVTSLERTKSRAHVLISSSVQETKDNLYGKSKKEGREALARWAQENNGKFTGLLVPNVFGPFGKPYYNSFISTFCHQLTQGETPVVKQDVTVPLIYVQELVEEIISIIRAGEEKDAYIINPTSERNVSQILELLEHFRETYIKEGEIPLLSDQFELNLFNTFRSYINYRDFFPRRFISHSDERGHFVEVMKEKIGGQTSFSYTRPAALRGNHFHIRKIERFAVIKGDALIELRKIDSNEVLQFMLSGDKPAYVDMPIWYTHNIKNIGSEDLITIFWINEPYNPNNPDTYQWIV